MFSHTSQYRRNLNGWFIYAFASEVFVIVSLTLFLPICLEQFARDNGFFLPEKTRPCSAATTDNYETVGCVVKIGWAWIDTTSFSLYVYSMSVALQAITVISMGGIADYPPHRKLLLIGFAAAGSLSAILFLFIPSTSPVWYLSAPLAMISNIGFGASIVAMNSYIPSLAREAPEVVKILTKIHQTDRSSTVSNDIDLEMYHESSGSANTPLLGPSGFTNASVNRRNRLQAEYQAELSRTTARISSFGIAIGYAAGIGMLVVTFIPVTMMHGSTLALRLAIGASGIWWAVFTIPAALWLPSSDSEFLRGEIVDKNWKVSTEIGAAWIRLVNMLRWREMNKLRNTFKYLAAWFLLSDGLTTITSTTLLFGKTTLHMSPSALILVGVLTPTSGILGSLVLPLIQRRCGWSNLKVLVVLAIMVSLIPVYGCLGFIFQGHTSFGGLTTQGEMFVLGIYFGSVYGAFQGYARAFYAELLPPGGGARWYGLFSIAGKSSSFIGPLMVGLISDATGNIRYSFFFLMFMIWAALPILASVDVDRGRKDAQEYEYRSGAS